MKTSTSKACGGNTTDGVFNETAKTYCDESSEKKRRSKELSEDFEGRMSSTTQRADSLPV